MAFSTQCCQLTICSRGHFYGRLAPFRKKKLSSPTSLKMAVLTHFKACWQHCKFEASSWRLFFPSGRGQTAIEVASGTDDLHHHHFSLLLCCWWKTDRKCASGIRSSRNRQEVAQNGAAFYCKTMISFLRCDDKCRVLFFWHSLAVFPTCSKIVHLWTFA